MSDPTRRAILAGTAFAAIGSTEILAYARPMRAAVSPAATDLHKQLDAAVREVQATTQALDAAIASLESSLPKLHPDLVWRRGGPLPHALCAIERRFNGEVVGRGLDLHGHPSARYIASPRLIESELARPTFVSRKGWRRFLRRTLKRARRYQARLMHAERHAIAAEAPMMDAKRRLEELATRIAEMPSTTHENIALKAHALIAYSGIDDQTWRVCQAGSWGTQLAKDVLAQFGRAV